MSGETYVDLDGIVQYKTDLATIRERHRPVTLHSGRVICNDCGQAWGEAGCDTAQVLADNEKLREALAAIVISDLRPDFEDGKDIILSWVGNKADWEHARAALADTGSAGDD